MAAVARTVNIPVYAGNMLVGGIRLSLESSQLSGLSYPVGTVLNRLPNGQWQAQKQPFYNILINNHQLQSNRKENLEYIFSRLSSAFYRGTMSGSLLGNYIVINGRA